MPSSVAARPAFRSSFGGVRFSPRPGRRSRIRQYHFEGSLEYVTSTRNELFDDVPVNRGNNSPKTDAAARDAF